MIETNGIHNCRHLFQLILIHTVVTSNSAAELPCGIIRSQGMFTSQSCVFAVNYQARSLAPQKASKDRHRFLVGTCSLHDSNELSVLEYHENSNQIEATAIYSHPDQIWSIEPSPNDTDLVITSSQSSRGEKSLILWRMPNQGADDLEESSAPVGDKLNLIKESTFAISDRTTLVQNIKWHHTQNKILTADSDAISLWSVGDSSAKVFVTIL